MAYNHYGAKADVTSKSKHVWMWICVYLREREADRWYICIFRSKSSLVLQTESINTNTLGL